MAPGNIVTPNTRLPPRHEAVIRDTLTYSPLGGHGMRCQAPMSRRGTSPGGWVGWCGLRGALGGEGAGPWWECGWPPSFDTASTSQAWCCLAQQMCCLAFRSPSTGATVAISPVIRSWEAHTDSRFNHCEPGQRSGKITESLKQIPPRSLRYQPHSINRWSRSA